MTLTEEQRAALAHAINYIDETDLPVGELDGFDREVLRAMIDSSDPIPDVTELVELLAAGEHEQWAVWAQAILDSEPGLSDRRKATWPEMIATPYENLSEELKDEDRRVVHLRSQAALDYIQQQSTEIERLQLELTQALKDLSSKDEIIEKLKKEFLKSTYERNKIRHGHAWYPGDEDYNEYLQRIDADAHKKSQESLDDVLRGN